MKQEILISFQFENSERIRVITLSSSLYLRALGLLLGSLVFGIFFLLLSPLESTTQAGSEDPEDISYQLRRTMELSEALFARQAELRGYLSERLDEGSLENSLKTFGDARLADMAPSRKLLERLQIHSQLITSNGEFAGTYQFLLGPVPRLIPIESERMLVNSPYGWRTDPFSKRLDFHGGLDIKTKVGVPVRATAAGRVWRAELNRSGYGKLVVIEHDSGYQTYYAHLDSIQVSKNDYVHAGQRIGSSGQTGRATGPHLHYEVRYAGQQQNPEIYIPM